MDNLLPIQRFAAAANETFDVLLGEAAVTMTLVEVKPLPPHPYPGMLREPFSLLFRCASPVILPQKSYHMKNPTVGAHHIFLVPVAKAGPDVMYQAVFN